MECSNRDCKNLNAMNDVWTRWSVEAWKRGKTEDRNVDDCGELVRYRRRYRELNRYYFSDLLLLSQQLFTRPTYVSHYVEIDQLHSQ